VTENGEIKSVCEEQNYRRIYERHALQLRNFIYYKCSDLEKAEDIAQESLIKLWENCASVVFEKAKSFLFTVANRMMIDHFRHTKIRLNFMKDKPQTHTREDASFELETKEFEAILEKAIADLPDGQRETFLMNRIDKMTYEEIAEMQGISVKAVEKRMHNALHTLKEKVKELKVYKI
jgi:RNA polymerase sigma-70 factor (family 1)